MSETVSSAAVTAPGYGGVVNLKNVVKTYHEDGINVTAVDHVTLDLPRQKFAAIVGPSGSGKTTLLNLMGCIDRATSGEVLVCGEDVGRLSEHDLTAFRASKIAFVFQHFSLLPILTAYENVEYPLLLLKLSSAHRREAVMTMLDAVGLADKAGFRPNQLSGGQKQRIAIARALVKHPTLVLADEPTANLDSHTGQTIIELMRKIQHEHGATFVFSTHDPQLISHADATLTIRDGKLVEQIRMTNR